MSFEIHQGSQVIQSIKLLHNFLYFILSFFSFRVDVIFLVYLESTDFPTFRVCFVHQFHPEIWQFFKLLWSLIGLIRKTCCFFTFEQYKVEYLRKCILLYEVFLCHCLFFLFFYQYLLIAVFKNINDRASK